MASNRLKLPPSPIRRTPSPINNNALPFPEEKRKHGQEILGKLQTTNRSTSMFLTAVDRSATCYQLSSAVRPENTQTIKEKVRSTDNLSGKGLLAADLIKNLQSQQKSLNDSPFPRAISAGAQGKAFKTNLVIRPHSENSNRLSVPFASSLDRRRSLPAPTLKQKSRAAKDILRKYGSSDSSTHREWGFNEGSLPSLRKVASANRLTTIHHESAEDDERDGPGANSMLDVKKHPRRASISVPGEQNRRPLTSHSNLQQLGDKNVRVASPKSYRQGIQNTQINAKQDEILHKQNKNKKNVMESNVRKRIRRGEESSTSGSESDSEDEVEIGRPLRKNRTSVRNRNANILKDDQKEEENSCSDNGSEDNLNDDLIKRSRTKRKCVDRNSDDGTDEEENNEDSSDECSESEESEREESSEEKGEHEIGGTKKTKIPTDDSESEEESGVGERNIEDLLIDEELEELSKKFAVPGMPAMDLLETREKMAEERSNSKKWGNPPEEEEVDSSEDEAIDDVDDLIDDIDDLIDADDEDITYSNKLKKKKTFTKGVKIVIQANRMNLKDKK